MQRRGLGRRCSLSLPLSYSLHHRRRLSSCVRRLAVAPSTPLPPRSTAPSPPLLDPSLGVKTVDFGRRVAMKVRAVLIIAGAPECSPKEKTHVEDLCLVGSRGGRPNYRRNAPLIAAPKSMPTAATMYAITTARWVAPLQG
ncbi:hypothetical protein AAHA92_09679 [Salvia divinorum]|uniref:Uncharacterized protein n=1 Tax=Salvia divinorum TaxID=28513 RepID=A0ABD1HSD7_SALDI